MRALGFAGLLIAIAPTWAAAPSWSVETLEPRRGADGAMVRMGVAVLSPVSAETTKHVLLYPQPGSESRLKKSTGPTELNLAGPWTRSAAQLAERGIAMVYLDPPSDAAGRILGRRAPGELRDELRAAMALARQRFPSAQLHLAGFGTTATLLEAAAGLDGVSRVVMVSGSYADARTLDLRAVSRPVMFVQAPTAQCDAAPYPEAEQLARRHRFVLVQAGYAARDAREDCGRDSQHALTGLHAEFTELVAGWLDGREAPAGIGAALPGVAWREQVITYPAPATLGTHQLEMTLMLPDGPGPFPVVVFNHGDIEIDHPSQRYRRRIREMAVSREFLRLGFAVALPARRGVGLSEGLYPRGFSSVDGDPGYKARVHAPDIVAALKYLKTRPEIDAARIVLAGHSAGGYSAMYLAGTQPEGVIGVIDFSGGRTDSTSSSGPGYLNRMMVDGFAEFGRQIRVPTLWVFAENDSRYSANTIRASHEAFVAAGGTARLSLSPPVSGDGHQVYHQPELWRGAVRDYLAEITAGGPAK